MEYMNRDYKNKQLELTDLNADGHADYTDAYWKRSVDGRDESDDIEESKRVTEQFESFCSRMWLDNCDENKAFGAVSYTKDEYISKYNTWLWEKFQENNGIVGINEEK